MTDLDQKVRELRAWGDYDNASPVQRAAYHAYQAAAASTYRARLSAALSTTPAKEVTTP